MRKVITYGGGLIALYLLVAYSTGSGRVISAIGSSGSTVVKTLQGR